MIKIYPSLETCTSCSGSAAVYAPGQSQTPAEKENSGFTYDNGSGVKTNVSTNGPFSAMLRGVIGTVFQKQALVPNTEAPEADNSEVVERVATEAMAQDVHLAELANQLQTDPEFEIVLPNFKKDEVDAHTNAVTSGGVYNASLDPAPVDSLAPSSSINMYATNLQDILQPRTQEIITELSKDAPTVAYIEMSGGETGQAAQFIEEVKATSYISEHGLEAAVADALERMIGCERIQVYVGAEQLKDYLKNN